ncbi:type IV pilus modification protein PilV [Hydrocarboniclastica marina]|nr:type IV pilus modification protein PilV [Hydrocarboniclastica marina]
MTRKIGRMALKNSTSGGARRQAGIGMIEVLVAVLILAIGLLGLAALQVSSMQFTTAAQARSQATLLAHDMLERMRVNRTNIDGYNSPLPGDPAACDVDHDPGNNNVPADDLAEWRNQLACLLPLGNGGIEVVGQQATVSVEWVEDRNEPDDPISFSFTAGL